MQITEVKQSKGNENVEHIEPIELKNKPTVYSQAHFVRIKTGEDTNKLSLKIGRYKKSDTIGYSGSCEASVSISC